MHELKISAPRSQKRSKKACPFDELDIECIIDENDKLQKKLWFQNPEKCQIGYLPNKSLLGHYLLAPEDNQIAK